MALLGARAIESPFTAAKLAGLKVGEAVLLSGRVFTGRDRLHKYLFDGGASPVDLKDGAIYHCGPVVLGKPGAWVVRAAGPTTSAREEPYLPRIIEKHGVRVVIGKGGLGAATQAACARWGCVYLHAVGGAAQVLAERIERVCAVCFADEFGQAEAMWELTVKDFPAIVAIDAHGRSLCRRVLDSSRRELRSLIRDSAPFVG